MILLLAGLILFFGVHCISIVAPQWRTAQVARLGEARWKGVYSLASGIGLAMLIIGFGMARQTGVWLYHPALALRHLTLVLMLPVFPLLIATYLPGRISRAAKHPMLLAVKIWALAHLLSNGSLADVLFFGAFLAWAVVDRISIKRRAAAVAHDAPALPARAANDLIAVLAGLVIYAVFLLGFHRWLTGVSPLM